MRIVSEARTSPFVWTDDRLDQLKRLYLVEVGAAEAVAAVIGCSRKAVVQKANLLGYGAERRAVRKAMAKRPRRCRRKAVVLVGPAATDAELVAAAVAAGRVTILPAGHACGTSTWERAMGVTARPPGMSWNGGLPPREVRA
ncbi:MAG: hypothetical protein JWP92_3718 [Caulobacter sp.]|nr:hypothetical protein [Caulobacter sp.]